MKEQSESKGSALVEDVLSRAAQAAAIFNQLDQEQTDRITEAVYKEGLRNRIKLAKMAHAETGIGRWDHKVIKNVIATQYVYDDIKNLKTVGIISEDPLTGISEIAQPIGPILAIIPCTNPTSTALFKILISLKTRNPIIISPHHRALASCRETVRICYEAALSAGAPDDCIIFFERASREDTKALMSDRRLALILATGGESVVKAAYSSGTPALGVGAGNVPVFIERTADVPFAIAEIYKSKLFDNGTICASEQALVVEKCIAARVREELLKMKAFILSREQIDAVGKIAFDADKHVMRGEIIGRTALEIATLAGVVVPEDTTLLVAPLDVIGPKEPLSSEILAPVIALYEADSFDKAVNLCIDLNFYGGIGHTASIFSNDEAVIKKFSVLMNAGRVVVNMPSSQGAVGGTYSCIPVSFTLGCGTGGKNITSDNVTAKHLLNIQRICRRRVNQRMMQFDNSLYFDETATPEAIEKAFNKNY
jgi:acetaldehyde dehydrogenase/alcohol dehydrogenase